MAYGMVEVLNWFTGKYDKKQTNGDNEPKCPLQLKKHEDKFGYKELISHTHKIRDSILKNRECVVIMDTQEQADIFNTCSDMYDNIFSSELCIMHLFSNKYIAFEINDLDFIKQKYKK